MSHHYNPFETVQNIERSLRQNDLQPLDFVDIFRDLADLAHSRPENIKKDLFVLNKVLHDSGLLPNLEIILYEDGLAVVADSHNAQHRAIVSIGETAPMESDRERRTYRDMGYNGWRDSVGGGGGADGGYDRRAAEGTVPHPERDDLISAALQLAGVADTPANRACINTIVNHESSWNPNAINLWDSNAERGHPSQGLMQCIPSTFRAYALPGYDTNINDPLSNMVAGIRYAVDRYGSLDRVPGVAAVAECRDYVGY